MLGQDSIDNLLSQADALMEEVGVKVETGEAPVKVEEVVGPEQPRMTLHCDVNGCTIAPVVSEASTNKGPLGKQ